MATPKPVPFCPPMAYLPPAYRFHDPAPIVATYPCSRTRDHSQATATDEGKSVDQVTDLEAGAPSPAAATTPERRSVIEKVKDRLSRVALKWWLLLTLIVALLMIVGIGVGAMALRKAVNGGNGRHGLIVG